MNIHFFKVMSACEKNKVTFDEFVKRPEMLSDPDLVCRIVDR